MKILRISLKILFILFGIFISINMIGNLYSLITPKIDIKNANSFYLYDKNDSLVFQGSGKEKWIDLEDMSDNIIKATISVEDKNFFKHNGFDFLRIGKAMLENIKAFDIVQGASTISQQYAKNLFLSFDKTWSRKWQEMWLTFDLEAHYSKEEILEGYLNTINYGQGMYGIGNAAKYYFDKDVKDLTLAEATILVGIPNSPSNYSPLSNYKLSKQRQLVVLNRMYENGYINKEEKETAYEEKLVFYGKEDTLNMSTLMYYQDAVMEELLSLNSIPKSYIETGGLKIYTLLDINAQNSLEQSIKNNLKANVQTASVMMNPNDGAIIALVGGSDYSKSQFNRATNSVRQPGSTIKPFLYYQALDNGFTSSSTFTSEPTTFNFANKTSYSPKNSGSVYGNKNISLAAAIAYSDNIYAVKTHIFLGEEMLLDMLKNVGITTKLEPVPSLPLGSYDVNIIELTGAYATFANSGKKVTPHLIAKIEDINGNVLYTFKEKEEFILDPSLTFIISELLTGSYDNNLIDYSYPTCINILSKLTHKYAVKSGSTTSDAWVVGYTPEVILTSWSGYDDASKIETSSVVANKHIWADAMESYLKGKKTTWYEIPKNVVGVLVDPISGNLAKKDSQNKKILYYLKDTEPLS